MYSGTCACFDIMKGADHSMAMAMAATPDHGSSVSRVKDRSNPLEHNPPARPSASNAILKTKITDTAPLSVILQEESRWQGVGWWDRGPTARKLHAVDLRRLREQVANGQP